MTNASVDCWLFPLDVPDAQRAALGACLSRDERARARRFTDPSVAGRWTTARGRLRHILASRVGGDPAELVFAYSGAGKPFLANTEGGWHFNLSHAADRGVVAVTRVGPVGVDIEGARHLPDFDRIVARFFSASERTAWSALEGPEAHAAFYRGWTRKEAVLKGLGTGVFGGLDRFSVSLAPGPPPPPVFAPPPPTPAQWRLFDLDIGAGYTGALAVAATGPLVVSMHPVPP